MSTVVRHVIGGKPADGTSGRTSPVFNPATGAISAHVELASAEDVDSAVDAAASAFADWRTTSLARRTAILFEFRRLLSERATELAAIVTAEHGKVLSDALGEVKRGLENVEFACGLTSALRGGHSQQVSNGVDVHETKQPLGVVAGITPFNFPVMVPLWMIPIAIACGNTFVLKPSERDPSASLLIADMLADAGLPPGVFNVVQGDHVAVDRLIEHPTVRALSFVGSTPVAERVYREASARGKRVQALGGAKNHMVVAPDADLASAANAAVSAAYGSAGERCMAVSVVVAIGSIADQLVELIAAGIANLRVGDGGDAASTMGPLVTREHRDRVVSYVDAGAKDGATLVVDGRAQHFNGDGFFLAPTLFDHVTPSMSIYTDEIFGPVLAVVRVDSYDEALALISENSYGNGASIFTRDGGLARQFEFDVDAGMVGINVPIPVPVAAYSFGGWKSSLFGDTHVYGHEGVHFYTRTKVVTTRWPDSNASGINMAFPHGH